jgi:hypothetical protein
MVAKLRDLKKRNVQFLFTDRHAYLVAAQFYSELDRLDGRCFSGEILETIKKILLRKKSIKLRH